MITINTKIPSIGYHTGVISGVLIMKDFRKRIFNDHNSSTMDIETNPDPTGGFIVGILLLGCFLGSLIGGQTSDRFSRKYSIAFFSLMFTISTAIQTGTSWLSLLLIGRFFAGNLHLFVCV